MYTLTLDATYILSIDMECVHSTYTLNVYAGYVISIRAIVSLSNRLNSFWERVLLVSLAACVGSCHKIRIGARMTVSRILSYTALQGSHGFIKYNSQYIF